MSKARELAELGAVYDSGALSNRNIVINGAMQVAQRGTSASVDTGFGMLTVDRTYFTNSGLDETAITQAQVADAPSNSGFTYSYKATVTTPETTLDGSEWGILNHRVEAQNVTHLDYGSSGAKSTTLSFWVKSSVTGTYAILVYVEDSSTPRSIVVNYTISAANTWEYKALSIAGDTGGTGINNDNGTGLDIYWTLSAGPDRKGGTTPTVWGDYAQNRGAEGQTADIVSTNGATWQITGVQLEVGTEATPFEHRSIGDEVLRCQRYYNEQYYRFEGVFGASGNGAPHEVSLPVAMRAAPTLSSGTNTKGGDVSSLNSLTNFTGSSLASSVVVNLNFSGTGNGYIFFNLIADAEL